MSDAMTTWAQRLESELVNEINKTLAVSDRVNDIRDVHVEEDGYCFECAHLYGLSMSVYPCRVIDALDYVLPLGDTK